MTIPSQKGGTSIGCLQLRELREIVCGGGILTGTGSEHRAATEQVYSVAIGWGQERQRHGEVGNGRRGLLERAVGAARLAVGFEVERLKGHDKTINANHRPQMLLGRMEAQ